MGMNLWIAKNVEGGRRVWRVVLWTRVGMNVGPAWQGEPAGHLHPAGRGERESGLCWVRGSPGEDVQRAFGGPGMSGGSGSEMQSSALPGGRLEESGVGA